jgi:hypothetical protein
MKYIRHSNKYVDVPYVKHYGLLYSKTMLKLVDQFWYLKPGYRRSKINAYMSNNLINRLTRRYMNDI